MNRCARFNKKRCVLDRIFGHDKELCGECLFDTGQEIREKHILPVRSQKDDSEGKA